MSTTAPRTPDLDDPDGIDPDGIDPDGIDPDDVLTRTEEAAAGLDPAPDRKGPRPARRRKPWWRRRPIRRALVFLHRWPTMVLGLFLVIETTSGAVLLYHGEYFRATHDNLYRHTASAHPVSLQQATAIVQRAHPDFTPSYVAHDGGVILLAGAKQIWAVDPGTGRINGSGVDGGTMGFLLNLHDCALTCPPYPGSVSWLAKPVPTLGLSWLTGITWSAAILVVLGLLMVLLAISGVVLWWPGRKRLSHGFRVRTGRGRFARDYDLHNVIGIVAVPFILMWGVTGAAFEAPVVQKIWIEATGGHYADPDETYSFTPDAAPKNTPIISMDTAIAAAQKAVPGGRVAYVGPPADPAAPYYDVSLTRGHSTYGHRLIYSGDRDVYVDAHDPTHVKVVDVHSGPAANRFYNQIFEGSHFAWLVGPWWRIAWFVLGMTPFVLMLTGVSTFLFRHGTRRRKNAAARARRAALDPA